MPSNRFLPSGFGISTRLTDWLGLVRALHQLRADVRPMRFEVAPELIDSHAMDARCACQPKVEMSPFDQSRDVPLVKVWRGDRLRLNLCGFSLRRA